jgi:hypothetical protein
VKIDSCRLCGAKLPKLALLELQGMPGAAQFLPTLDELAHDKGADLFIFECSQCGLVQTCQEPVTYYKEVIRASAFSSEMAIFRQQQLKGWVDKNRLTGLSILEIGAGKGEYLQLLQQTGLQAYGTEFGENSVQQCHQLGFQVYQAFPDGSGLNINDAPFDAFASFSSGIFIHLLVLMQYYSHFVDNFPLIYPPATIILSVSLGS